MDQLNLQKNIYFVTSNINFIKKERNITLKKREGILSWHIEYYLYVTHLTKKGGKRYKMLKIQNRKGRTTVGFCPLIQGVQNIKLLTPMLISHNRQSYASPGTISWVPILVTTYAGMWWLDTDSSPCERAEPSALILQWKGQMLPLPTKGHQILMVLSLHMHHRMHNGTILHKEIYRWCNNFHCNMLTAPPPLKASPTTKRRIETSKK